MKKILVWLSLLPLIVAAVLAMLVFHWRHTPQGVLTAPAAVIARLADWQEQRAGDESITQMRERRRAGTRSVVGKPAPMAEVRDLMIPGSATAIPARLYRPFAGEHSLPLVVYFHGGGWMLGDLDSHDKLCRTLARESGALVLAVDYRLAPEHVFPAALDDAWSALRWAQQQAVTLGADPARIAVAGDSAGGNLAAATALRARAQGAPALFAQVLIYPALDLAAQTRPSMQRYASGYFLSRERLTKMIAAYVPNAADRSTPEASPLLAASHAGLPPTLVLTAEFDPLRDEGEAYAAALKEAGVPVRLLRFPGLIHGFASMDRWFPEAAVALAQAGAHLRQYSANDKR